MIFIAYDEANRVSSIVNAKSEEIALAYWQGANVNVFSHKSANDFPSLSEHPTGIYPILKTDEVSLSDFGKTPKKYRIVVK